MAESRRRSRQDGRLSICCGAAGRYRPQAVLKKVLMKTADPLETAATTAATNTFRAPTRVPLTCELDRSSGLQADLTRTMVSPKYGHSKDSTGFFHELTALNPKQNVSMIAKVMCRASHLFPISVYAGYSSQSQGHENLDPEPGWYLS